MNNGLYFISFYFCELEIYSKSTYLLTYLHIDWYNNYICVLGREFENHAKPNFVLPQHCKSNIQ